MSLLVLTTPNVTRFGESQICKKLQMHFKGPSCSPAAVFVRYITKVVQTGRVESPEFGTWISKYS